MRMAGTSGALRVSSAAYPRTAQGPRPGTTVVGDGRQRFLRGFGLLDTEDLPTRTNDGQAR